MFAQVLSLAALASAVAAQSTLKINTPPALTLCEPSLITWEGGAAPYIVSVIPGGQQSAAALKYLSQGTNDKQFTWKIDIEAGTQVTLKVLDNTGFAAFSAPVSIQGTDRSCLAGAGGEASASEAAPSASESEAPAPEASSSEEAAPSEAASESASETPAASPSAESAAASPSAASPSPASASPATSSAASSTSSRAAASTTSASKSVAPSPSASADSGAMANAASFGVLAAAGALAALF